MVSIFLGVVVGAVVAPVLDGTVVPGTVVAVCALPEPPPSLHANASSATPVRTTTRRRAHDRSEASSQRRNGGRFGDNANLVGGGREPVTLCGGHRRIGAPHPEVRPGSGDLDPPPVVEHEEPVPRSRPA